ncbi:MAG: hypothetical protein R2704_16275 [Microthrixaceae bacterium]
MGDLGRLVDGRLYLEGRRDDLIISGGVNVYPAEIEAALRPLPELDDVVAFGSEDPEWGQAVNVVVVPHRADHDPAELVRAVDERACASLAPYKRPKLTVRRAIPVSSTGKVRRSTLAADLGLTPGRR